MTVRLSDCLTDSDSEAIRKAGSLSVSQGVRQAVGQSVSRGTGSQSGRQVGQSVSRSLEGKSVTEAGSLLGSRGTVARQFGRKSVSQSVSQSGTLPVSQRTKVAYAALCEGGKGVSC